MKTRLIYYKETLALGVDNFKIVLHIDLDGTGGDIRFNGGYGGDYIDISPRTLKRFIPNPKKCTEEDAYRLLIHVLQDTPPSYRNGRLNKRIARLLSE